MSKKVRLQLSEAERRSVFKALVDAQDRRVLVGRSRALVAERFSIPEYLVLAIEEEGIDATWPPLGRQAGLLRGLAAPRR
jgi:hypothetical protein